MDFNETELCNSCACMRVLHDEWPDGAKVNACAHTSAQLCRELPAYCDCKCVRASVTNQRAYNVTAWHRPNLNFRSILPAGTQTQQPNPSRVPAVRKCIHARSWLRTARQQLWRQSESQYLAHVVGSASRFLMTSSWLFRQRYSHPLIFTEHDWIVT